jgi:hypothetical protein
MVSGGVLHVCAYRYIWRVYVYYIMRAAFIIYYIVVVTYFFFASSSREPREPAQVVKIFWKQFFFGGKFSAEKRGPADVLGAKKTGHTMVVRFCRAVFTCDGAPRIVLITLHDVHGVFVCVCGCVRESVSRRKRVPCTCVNNGPREDDDVDPAETWYYIILKRAVHLSCASCRLYNKRIIYYDNLCRCTASAMCTCKCAMSNI